ncbi:hypothetical protein [Kitasatospora cathayae]|uniref:Uncharacterized protein n=1 Tax=Kitasatospora cathayae TaxID=3004092 RepID=A0ABY7QGS1_9ACTN|nr:hypothetical protein [Kitasatospora sp. HUAS 3-15]WBP91995.1 hypothetical protein O1G21_40095 [Kitasatospora sp. HUAS 3-15]
MQQPAAHSATTPASAKPARGTYVLFRDMDRYLTGNPDHTQICKVLADSHYLEDKADLLVLATQEVIRFAPVVFMRPLHPAELMHDIDTAPLDALGDGRLMTAAGAWLAAQARQTKTNAPAALPAVHD